MALKIKDLIEGEWYYFKDTYEWFFKFKSYSDDKVFSYEYIDPDPKVTVHYRTEDNAHWALNLNFDQYRKIDLSEIQEWLPLNHLDRFENQQVIEQDYSYLIPIITKLNKQ